MKLYDYIVSINPSGIALEDAIQLMLGIYCSMDVLPPQFRNDVLGRNELSTMFAQMSKEGIICKLSRAEDPRNAGFWNGIIDDFMAEKVLLNDNFREVAASLLNKESESPKNS